MVVVLLVPGISDEFPINRDRREQTRGWGCPAYKVSGGRSPLRGLLEYHHLSCSRIVACGQAVEVDAACHGLTQFVFPIPVDSL